MTAAAKDACGAVLVTYHPDLDTLRTVLEATLPQVDRLLVVDNGSPEDLEHGLRAFIDSGKLEVRRLGTNFGIAYAQNRGLEELLAAGYTSLLILDQDSVPQPGMVDGLRTATQAARAAGTNVSAAGPRYLDPRTGDESIFPGLGRWRFSTVTCADAAGSAFIRTDWLISSGMLIEAAVLRHVGLMREDLFIDEVDTEWCLRARAKGYRSIAACGAVMAHTLGSDTIRLRLKSKRSVPVHSPIRLYYIVRNAFLLARMPHVPPTWWIPNFKRLATVVVLFSTIVPPRLRNLAMMLRGLRDGVLNRSGPYGIRPGQR